MRVLPLAAAAALPLLAASPAIASDAPPQQVVQVKLAAAKAAGSPGGYAPGLAAPADVLTESEPNDSPATANALDVLAAIECTLTAADSDWFQVTAAPGGFLTISTSQLSDPITDTFLLLFASDGVSPLAADDDGGAGLFSAIEHFACPPDGAFFVKVRHFSPAGTGSYRLLVEPGAPAPSPPSNDTCASAIDVACNGMVTGSTAAALPDLDAVVACTGYTPTGPDVFYRVQVPYSYQLRVQVSTLTSFDPALYVFRGCGQGMTCVAGADLAFVDEDELVTWVNEIEGPPQELYVAVDSWSSDSRGDFVLQVSCEFIVPNEQSTWGAVKSLYAR